MGRHSQSLRLQGPEITWVSLDQNMILNSVDNRISVIWSINVKSVLLSTYETLYFTLKYVCNTLDAWLGDENCMDYTTASSEGSSN